MKKISIIFAVLAVFMLLASCSNAAGEVDLAGNPVNLTGTWSGTIAYKQDADPDLPMSCKPKKTIDGEEIVGYTDYAGTYVENSSITAPADFTEKDTEGTSVTERKHLYYGASTTTSKTTVLNPDGGMTITEVETLSLPEKTAIGSVGGTVYYINTNLSNPNSFTPYAAAYAQVGGTKTTTTTTTYSAPVKNAKGKYDYSEIVTTSIVPTGSYGTTSSSTTDQTNFTDKTFAEVQENFKDLKIKDRTVAPTLKPVVWQNDITETITLEVTNDGLYTLTNVMTETQTAAAAAAATETNYAAAERKAGTKTTTTTTTGTIAAWETPATDSLRGSTTMALSSGVETTSVDKTNFFVDGYSDIPTIAKFGGAKEYDIRFLEGKAGRKETAKTRMYVNVSDKLDPNGCIAIFDKAVETEEK